MLPPRDRDDTRRRLLDAAEAIVAERGVTALTLEKVAAAAGVSKGGLLHHFPSKEALLRAIVTRMAEEMRAVFDMIYALCPPGPGRAARAAIAWALHKPAEREARDLRIAAALLAAHAHDPALIDPIRAEHARIREMMADDGLPEGRAMTLMAATDGLFLAKVFSLWHPSEALAASMEATMRAMAEP
ncbi:MAG: TetR/AcrR family transcriptional regulator [Acetobacteraceae bacterium]|jgi:AcrR family transcriptional regulator|nr:TetR/AcrR family transcriptional regulator [Acetobacteraceae bacterium]